VVILQVHGELENERKRNEALLEKLQRKKNKIKVCYVTSSSLMTDAIHQKEYKTKQESTVPVPPLVFSSEPSESIEGPPAVSTSHSLPVISLPPLALPQRQGKYESMSARHPPLVKDSTSPDTDREPRRKRSNTDPSSCAYLVIGVVISIGY